MKKNSSEQTGGAFDGVRLIDEYLDGSLDENALSIFKSSLEDGELRKEVLSQIEMDSWLAAMPPEYLCVEESEADLSIFKRESSSEELALKVLAKIQPRESESGISDILNLGEVIRIEDFSQAFGEASEDSAENDHSANRKKRQILSILVVLGSGLAAACLAFLFQSNQTDAVVPAEKSSQTEPRLNLVAGKVKSSGQALAEGVDLLPGTLVETAAESVAEIVYADNTTIQLGPETSLEVAAPDTSRKTDQSLVLNVGKLLASVTEKVDGSQLKVRTPHAIATVIGTRFELLTGEYHTELRVFEGTVLMTRLDGTDPFYAKELDVVRLGNGFHEVVHGKGGKLNSREDAVTFSLVDSVSGDVIAEYDPIPKGAKISLSSLPTSNFTVKVNAPDEVDSVRVSLNGEPMARGMAAGSKIKLVGSDTVRPFSLLGGAAKQGKFKAWQVSPGEYEIGVEVFYSDKTKQVALPEDLPPHDSRSDTSHADRFSILFEFVQ